MLIAKKLSLSARIAQQRSCSLIALLLMLCCGYFWSDSPPIYAAEISPSDARAAVAEAENSLIELNYYLSDEAFHQGDFIGAARILMRITEIDTHDVDAYATAAWLLWSAKKNAEAEEIYQRMITNNPKNSTAFFEVGLYYVRIKQDEKAAPYLATATSLGGLPREQHDLYGFVLARLQRFDEAIEFWKATLAADAENATAKRELEKLIKEQNERNNPPPTPAKP